MLMLRSARVIGGRFPQTLVAPLSLFVSSSPAACSSLEDVSIALHSNCTTHTLCESSCAFSKRTCVTSSTVLGGWLGGEVKRLGPSSWSGEVPGIQSNQGLLLAQQQQRRPKTKAPYQQDVEPLVDEAILEMGTEEVRVVSADGTHEVLSVKRALHKAKRSKLNLVVVHQHASPPVCRLLDYGYFKFNQTKKEKERSKSNQKGKQKRRKEVQLGTKISTGHMEMKYNAIVRFLNSGHQVKITAIDARGDDFKEDFLKELKQTMEEDGFIISQPVKVEQARKASMMVNPKRK